MSYRQFQNTQNISRQTARNRIVALDPLADVDVYPWFKGDEAMAIGGSYVSVQSECLTDVQIKTAISAPSNPSDNTPSDRERIAAAEAAILSLMGV